MKPPGSEVAHWKKTIPGKAGEASHIRSSFLQRIQNQQVTGITIEEDQLESKPVIVISKSLRGGGEKAISTVLIEPNGNDLFVEHRHFEASVGETAKQWILIYFLWIIGILTAIFLIGWFLMYMAMQIKPTGEKLSLPYELKQESDQLRKAVETAILETLQ